MEEQNPQVETAPPQDGDKCMEVVSLTDVSQATVDMDSLLKKIDYDPYNEDETELRFLHSKPTCFIVIGKPGSGRTTLAKRLAMEWKCELISSTDLLQQNIDMQTEFGMKCLEILLKGEAVSEEMMIKMFEDKINSPEVAHHGYVLDDFPTLSESTISAKDQLELVKNWKLKPDFIINLKVPDKDLERRRVGQKIDPVTGDIYTEDVYNPERPVKEEKEGDGEEEEEEEEAEEEETGNEDEDMVPELPAEVLERIITRPEDLPTQVELNIRTYKKNLLRMLEEYMADHDQQYLIELDGNQTAITLFKQLQQRLNCFVLRPAAVPMRLHDQEEEEIPEDIDTDELMRSLAPKQMVAPRFRWKRSKWLRNCPVALHEGNIIPGKPDMAVSFLDKMYCMSSGEALEKFLKNPRPYLLPPQPRPPCKISVLGPPYAGKTSFCHLLAQKYGAEILDMEKLIQPRMELEKKKNIENIRKESTEAAINQVRAKIKEQMEAEQAAKEAAEGQDSTVSGEPSVKDSGPTLPDIDATHPDVIAIVEQAVKDAEKTPVSLSPEIYLEIMEEAIREAEKQMRESKPDGPLHGGWILDNFPNTRDQWNLCIEKNFIPDDVIVLKDSGDGSKFLMKRYYNMHKDDIDEKIKQRLKEEEERKIRLEQERKRQEEEEKARAKAEAERKAEEERKRKEEEGEGGEEEEDAGEGEQKDDEGNVEQQNEIEGEKEEQTEEPITEEPTTKPDDDDGTEGDNTKTEITEGESTDENRVEFKEEEKIPDGPEMEEYKEKRKEFERDFPNVLATISGGSNIDPIQLDIEQAKIEELLEEAITTFERQYKYQGWEYQGMDVDEEEEDLEADAAAAQEEEEEQEPEGEEEDPNRSKKKPLGDTNHYCPVVLKETNVLYPGNPETAAKYREKVYYFSTVEAREKFLASPDDFLPKTGPPKTPPIRLLLLGPRGSGKTLHGRQLAKKLGLFHISFKDRLQELIMHKTKKKIGPEYEEDNEEEPPEEEDEDEEGGAITDPEGKAVKDIPQDTSKVSDQSESKENQDEEEVEFTEEEESIKTNLESDEPLSNEVLENILPNWWQKEPFKSTGFILEGFPRTPEEARFLAESGLFPDASVILTVEDTDVIARLLPPRLDKWKVKRDKRLERKRKKKEKAQKKREAAIQKRREELTKESEERKKQRAAEKAAEKAERDEEEEEAEEEEEEEEEEEDDIEAQLAEEFEEEEEEDEEEEELEEDATDRMRNELNDVYDNDTNKLAAVTDTFDELLIPKIDVDSTRKPHIVRYTLNKKLKPVVDARQSMFERVYPINEKLARKMLATGYKQPSRFGRWCPVKVKDGECIQTMSGPGYITFPCIYRSHIYFLSSIQAREEFVNDPVKYVSQPTPKPVVPIKIAVVGPPKSGKTTLANRFAEEYGLLRLSIGEAMRMVMTLQPKSNLTKDMHKHLVKGLTVPDELAVAALETCLLDMKCQTRGYVLDGFPQTKRQIELLTERCLIPVRVFELNVDGKEIMVRGTKDRIAVSRTVPVHDSPQILATKLNAYTNNIEDVRTWYKTEHMNYKLIDGQRSKWWVWNTTLEASRESVRQIQTYLQRISDGKASSICDLCITPAEFLQRVGDYDQYCPVSLALRGELVDCSTNTTLDYAVEFRGHYYKCAGPTELNQFLEEPEKYVPPLAPHKLPPPSKLPKRRKPEQVKASAKIELNGYCPVTYLDGKCRYEAITPGRPEFIAEYTEKYWYCESEDKLLKFMKLPEQYAGLQLPHKLPPTKDNLSLTSLPMLGYMEQSVSTALTKAMTACGNDKPKYPFLSASRSALFYIAYHLKAFNPKSSDYVRKKYKRKLERFQETCDLIKYLGNNMTVRYKEPGERPQDFDYKLQTFFALRGIEPTPTWIS